MLTVLYRTGDPFRHDSGHSGRSCPHDVDSGGFQGLRRSGRLLALSHLKDLSSYWDLWKQKINIESCFKNKIRIWILKKQTDLSKIL